MYHRGLHPSSAHRVRMGCQEGRHSPIPFPHQSAFFRLPSRERKRWGPPGREFPPQFGWRCSVDNAGVVFAGLAIGCGRLGISLKRSFICCERSKSQLSSCPHRMPLLRQPGRLHRLLFSNVAYSFPCLARRKASACSGRCILRPSPSSTDLIVRFI